MAMTMRAVLDELDRLNGQMIDEIGRDELVRAVARAALLGARGNSGVILSQIVRGAAEELASRPGELVDPVLVAASFARAADAAYASVRDPAEGTMLSAVRAMAHRVAQDLAHMEKARLEQGASEEEQDAMLADVLERALEAANEAVERGPEQLPILKQAGVVDAGAYGLTAIVVGVIAALRGDGGPELAHQTAPHALHLPQHESSEYRYCTNFAVTGTGLDAREFIPRLEQIGDCVLVVGDQATLKVHVHTDEPDLATAMFITQGEVSHFDVADMHEQVADRTARLDVACTPVVIASGDGLVQMFRDLGAHVVDGGATMNPSTYDILAGVHAAPGDSAVVLPNSSNVIMAAERAAELSEKEARVVATRSQQQALAILLAFDPDSGAADNAKRLTEAGASLRTGGVARAAREDPARRFEVGDAVGYSGEDLEAWGEPAEVLAKTLKAVTEGCELVTCIAGEGAPLRRDAVERAVPDGVELDYHEGGQASWWWLLCAE
jgi:DAK2 domain fusion protein YloV